MTMPPESSNLTGQFLIAMPALNDPNFSRTVTLICEHSPDGCIGIIINRPIDIQLEEMLEQLGIKATTPEISRQPLYFGGPVLTDRGFVLHSSDSQWESTLEVSADFCLTSSLDILHAIARNEGPAQTFFSLGYAGWAAGQLEQELAENAWLSGPASAELIFKTAIEKRWHAAASLLGVDLSLISDQAGHA